jgi:hypothetical protein
LADIHTAEPLVPGESFAITKLKSYKSPGSDQIPAELIQTGGEILRSGIHKLFNSIWNKEELPDHWKNYIIVLVYKKGDKTDCSNYRGISVINFIQNFIQYPSLKVGDRQCGF